MGRHVGRSRGCQICRQRKIKCDEKSPECIQCLRSGRKCTGPLQGTFFLFAAETPTKSTVRDRKPSPRRPIRSDARSQNSLDVSHSHDDDSSQSSTLDGITWSEDVRMAPKAAKSLSESQLPSFYQPSRSPAFQELFLDHFISAFFDPRCKQNQPSQWSSALPSFLQSHEPNASIVHAIRAATMAHYAKITGDISIQLDSMRWYVRCLQGYQIENAMAQQKLVEPGSDGCDVFTEIVVTTPVMLMVFESIMGTVPSAWARHLKAVSAMLEVLGPWKCRRGILHNIFKVVRLGAVYMGAAGKKTTIFASEEWSTIPYLEVKKTAFDHLYDILLQIPESLELGQKLRQGVDQRRSSFQASVMHIKNKAQRLATRLREYWTEHSDEVDPDYTWDQYHEETDFQSAPHAWKPAVTGLQPVRFRDKFAARMIADYDAGSVIIYSILAEVSLGSDSVKEHKRSLTVHCASILAAATFLENLGVMSGGSTALIFPLKTVNLCSPSQQQKNDSAAELARWGKTRGVEGACEILKSTGSEWQKDAFSYDLI